MCTRMYDLYYLFQKSTERDHGPDIIESVDSISRDGPDTPYYFLVAIYFSETGNICLVRI